MTSTARWIGRWLMALLASFPVTTIGRNIKRRRERQGWSQAELAGKVGIHRISFAPTRGRGPRARPGRCWNGLPARYE